MFVWRYVEKPIKYINIKSTDLSVPVNLNCSQLGEVLIKEFRDNYIFKRSDLKKLKGRY